MNTSLNWLKEYIDITQSPEELEKGLTALGLECTIQKQKYSFSNVVIGYVKEKKQHPNADKLSVCKVNIGKNEIVQIVCGAPNVREGLKVPVIKVGGTLNFGEFKIKRTKLRSEESCGMICSEKELGLGDSHAGIMELDTELVSGSDFIQFLTSSNDINYNFELTPNRGDCFSHIGVAREIAILEKSNISERQMDLNESTVNTNGLIKVTILNEDACPRYATRIIKNVKVEPSPEWLSNRIQSIGLKSINNIVDLANYVMMDCGHPVHTFDLDKIIGNEIIVRFPKQNEKMKLLDESEIELKEHHLLICDQENPIALAGVMGGHESAINGNSKNILIECAYFDPRVVRKSAKSLDISTDASKRFERDTDIERIEFALNYLASLIKKVAGGEITKGIVDVGMKSKVIPPIFFSSKKCNRFLGIKLDDNAIEEIFNLLKITFEKENDIYNCTVPSYRNDLEREVDLFEEIARVYGYDNIPEEFSFTSNYNTFIKDEQFYFNKLREVSASNGFLEHYSNSLISGKLCQLFSKQQSIELSNPLSQEMAYLRNSLVPGLLNAVSINERRQQSRFKLLEIGQIHKKVESIETTSVESSSFALVWYDNANPHWRELPQFDIYQAKRDLFIILSKMGCNNLKLKETDALGFEYALEIKNKKIRIGIIGLISKKMLKQFNINNDVILFDGDLQKLTSISEKNIHRFKTISQFPVVTRDIAILVNSDISSGKLNSTIKQLGGDILTSVKLFDFYEGKELGINKKSMGYSLKFQSDEQTLNDKIIDKTIRKIVHALENEHGAIQR
jgi:phenylalanyl-tRNA synthetase beta chain